MDLKLVYTKTPIGEESVRQSTRVVQRNLRMVLVQVDGKLSVRELAEKIGNLRLVEGALRELEDGGFIAPTTDIASAREDNQPQPEKKEQVSALSQFSTFGAKPLSQVDAASVAGNYSSFGKPILPSSRRGQSEPPRQERQPEPEIEISPERTQRQVSYLKRGALVLLLGLLLLLGLAFFYPYGNFKPAIEVAVSRFLQTPVKIGQIGLAFEPLPQLKLTDVSLGQSADSRIGTLLIGSPHLLLGKGPYSLPEVRLSGASIAANSLVALPMFVSPSPASDARISIRRIGLEKSQMTAGDLVLQDVSGEILLKPDGSVEKASLQAFDRAIRLDMAPAVQGIILNIEGIGWRPAGLPFAFDSMQAKGLLQKDKLLVQDLDSTVLGGIIKGNLLLDWKAGLVLAGDASLSRLDCRKVSAAFVPALKLDGGLGGVLRFRAVGNDSASLLGNLEATLDADVSRGVLTGVDLGEAARRGQGSIVRSGSTRFDRLRTAININPRQISGREIRLEAGMMTANGQFVATRERQVDGNLTVGIQTSVSSLQVPVRVSGVLPDLTAFGGK